MKKLLWAVALCQVFFSCKKDEEPYLKFTENNVKVSHFDTSFDIAIQSNVDWYVYVERGADWVKLDKSSGHGNATVHVSLLKGTRTRSAIIATTAVTSNLYHEVIVDQVYYDLERLRQKYIGKAGSSINAIVPASDGMYYGMYLCVGRTNFNSSPGAADQSDAWIVLLSTLSDSMWTRTINRSSSDQANAVIATTDGGYIVAGETNNSINSFVTQKDWWLIKLKSNGDTAWTKVMGTDKHEFVNSMAATPDGGFVIIGLYDDSINNVQDMLMAKFTSDGNVVWQKKLGGSEADNGLAVSVDSKGYIFVAGITSSNNSGDVGSNHGENDSWVIKLNSNGDKVWSKVLGGNKTDGAYAISGTNDGGCIVGSSTYSSESGDVTGKNHGLSDMWVVKLDASGNITWNNLIGGSKYENVSADRIVLTPDGGYVLAGNSNSSDGDVGVNKGNYDNWVVKLNNRGKKIWSKTTGGSWDEGTSDFLLNTTFNSFYLVGSSNSNLNGAPATNGLFQSFNVIPN